MLGYVIPDKGELKLREYEIYTGYYCGICKSIGRRLGQGARLVLSYDAVFLAMVLAALSEEKETLKREHCILHPIDRKEIFSVFTHRVTLIIKYNQFFRQTCNCTGSQLIRKCGHAKG